MTGALEQFVSKIRSDLGSPEAVPGFDPMNGNEQAKFLFLLEAPGPQALKTGKISFDNPDPSARNFKRQLEEAGVQRGEIAIWNIVPWYLGTPDRASIRAATGEDVRRGMAYLPQLLAALPRLEAIVLVGSAARKAHVFLSTITRARILACHHTSARAQQANARAATENVAVFRMLQAQNPPDAPQ
jgi:uracil-DNA glycosylase